MSDDEKILKYFETKFCFVSNCFFYSIILFCFVSNCFFYSKSFVSLRFAAVRFVPNTPSYYQPK